jgi:hypothetical protein
MPKPMIRIHDLATDEVIDREMTTAEFNLWKADQDAESQRQAEFEAKVESKTALLDRLGITEDEAKLLLS